jgi:hypothetical protein
LHPKKNHVTNTARQDIQYLSEPMKHNTTHSNPLQLTLFVSVTTMPGDMVNATNSVNKNIKRRRHAHFRAGCANV